MVGEIMFLGYERANRMGQVGNGRSRGRGSQITIHVLVLNTVTDHDTRFLVELRITDLVLRQY